MANLTIGILNGDDIGHEIVPASVTMARAAAKRFSLDVDWRPMPVGAAALDLHGSTLPDGTLDALSKMDGFILGPIGHRAYPKVEGAINPHPIIRKHFGLFANDLLVGNFGNGRISAFDPATGESRHFAIIRGGGLRRNRMLPSLGRRSAGSRLFQAAPRSPRMPKAKQLRECIVCGEEADAAAMRGMVCLACRTADALKKGPSDGIVSAEEATVDRNGGTDDTVGR